MKKNNNFIAVSVIWFKRFDECSNTLGTSFFPLSVWKFYHSLLDLDDKNYKIKTIVKDYFENVWQPKVLMIVDRNTRNTTDAGTIQSEQELVESQYIVELFEFIIQTIQDSGIGWPTGEDVNTFMLSQE